MIFSFSSAPAKKSKIEAVIEVDPLEEALAGDQLQLTRQELDLAKQNFDIYASTKTTPIDLFELPMLLLSCGIKTPQVMLEKLHFYLDKERKVEKIDFVALALTLSHLKGLEAANEGGIEGDEYLDAFVFLGGSPDKEGAISKELLIEVIKEEFGLTIDMIVSRKKLTQFCVCLLSLRQLLLSQLLIFKSSDLIWSTVNIENLTLNKILNLYMVHFALKLAN